MVRSGHVRNLKIASQQNVLSKPYCIIVRNFEGDIQVSSSISTMKFESTFKSQVTMIYNEETREIIL